MNLKKWFQTEFLRSTVFAGLLWLVCGGVVFSYLTRSDWQRWKSDSALWFAQAKFHVSSKSVHQLELSSSLLLNYYPNSQLSISDGGTGRNSIWRYPISSSDAILREKSESTSNRLRFSVETPRVSIFSRALKFLILFSGASFAFLLLGWLILQRASSLASRELQALHRPDRHSVVNEFNELKQRISAYEEDRQRLRAESEMGRFQARLAHDLRAPLGTLRVLARSTQVNVPELQELLSAAEERIRSIAESVLDQRRSRVSHHSVESFKQAIALEARRQQKDLTLQCDLDDLEKMAEEQRAELLRHLTNLSLNSLDAFKASGEITLKATAEGESTRIALQDSGPGFTEEALVRFKKGSAPRSTKSAGNGIGISSCLDWIKARGGSFHASNRSDSGGAEITLTLPSGNSRRRDYNTPHPLSELR